MTCPRSVMSGWMRNVVAVGCVVVATTGMPSDCFADEADQSKSRIHTTDGKETPGDSISLTADSIKLRSGESEQSFAFADVIRVQLGEPKPTWNSRWIVVLENGDHVVLDTRKVQVSIDEVALSGLSACMQSSDSPKVKVPLETVHGIVLQVPEMPIRRFQMLRQMKADKVKNDVFETPTGDRVIGEFQELQDKAFQLETDTGVTKLASDAVRWMRFNPDLVSFPEAPRRFWLVRLSDGSRITAASIKSQPAGKLVLSTVFGAEIEVSPKNVVSLQPVGFGPTFLSDLDPAAYEFTPFLTGSWKLGRDRSVSGIPLMVNGREFDKGIGLHSKSSVTYPLNGQYSRLLGQVALNDFANGNVVCRVVLDGAVAWKSGPLTSASRNAKLGAIDLTDRKSLTIEVDFGARGDVQDHVDLVDAVLVPR